MITVMVLTLVPLLKLDVKEQKKLIVSITDVLGRPTKEALKTSYLFYIYDDGTVEKRIIKQK